MKATWRTTADEPASALLRRLIQDYANLENVEETTERIDAALPALADLVAAAERSTREGCPGEYGGVCEEPLCRALAALREQLEARP